MRNKKTVTVVLMAVLGISIQFLLGCVSVKLTEGGERASHSMYYAVSNN